MRNAEERLGGATVPAPAYAVAIFSHDPNELAAANIVVGLERDREVALQSADHAEALWRVWSPQRMSGSSWDFAAVQFVRSVTNYTLAVIAVVVVGVAGVS